MKKSILLFLFVCIANTHCKAQKKIDNTRLKCQYEYIYLNDTLEFKKMDDVLILQVGEKITKCFSYYSYQVDSIMALPNWYEITKKYLDYAFSKKIIDSNDYPHKRMKAYIYKNYPQEKMTVTDGLALQDYVYEDELNAQDWLILDSTETILDYPCQMAECNFRGRQWTAWFAPDIPISDGPWKFSGLPGLIMEAYDKGMQYHFKIIGLEKTEEPIVFSETYVGSKKFEKTNRIEFLKSQKRYLMDISGYIEMETGIDLSDGTPQKIMRYDLIERDYK